MKTYKESSVCIQSLDGVVCNFCGENIKKNDFGYYQDYISFEKQWGYGSPHDGDTHIVDICQHCYEVLLKKMKLPPQ